MRLYKVQATYMLYVMADSKQEAEKTADEVISVRDGSFPDYIRVLDVGPDSLVPAEWQDALPWSTDPEDKRTCSQIQESMKNCDPHDDSDLI